jgi:hypothetical protein
MPRRSFARRARTHRPEPEEAKILIRIFFHPHGRKLILLLSGYDKAEQSSKTYQNQQIEAARKLLSHWKQKQKARR